MKKIKIIKKIVITLFLLGNIEVNAQCRLDKTNYQLVFEDNFDTYTNIEQMKDRWQFTPSDPCYGWGYNKNEPDIDLNRGEYYDQSQVSLQPGGILRLSATKLDKRHFCLSSDGKDARTFFWKSGMIQTKIGWEDQSDSYTGAWDSTGFRYGMYEIRCKLPSKESFPAFWLYGGSTEIDIFEAGELNKFSNGLINWTTSPSTFTQNFYNWDLPFGNFTTEYHTFSCVWTPTEVTYFFDNRELRTVTSLPTFPFNCQLICNLGMWPWQCDNTFMDIDYIKVYKPIGEDYNLPYKSSNDFMNTTVYNSPSFATVSSIQNSIAPNPNNTNEIFFKDTWGRLFKSVYSNGNWSSSMINFNWNAPTPNCYILGSLTYEPNSNYILYCGYDNRIQYYTNSGSTNNHWFIDVDWNSNANLISDNPNSMDVTTDGKIAYRGLDNKIHIFKYNNILQQWDQLAINYTYGLCSGMPDADYVEGDVIVDKNTNNIIYRGRDGRLQIFWLQSPNNYQHAWIDNNWNTLNYTVSNSPGSIINTPNSGIYYKGSDDKLHRFYWNGSAMVHQESTYNYGQCAGMADADFIKGNLSFLPSHNYVLYIGRDGRIQHFEIPANNSSTTWPHYWIDDYWNTHDFISFNSSYSPIHSGSLITSNDGKMIYNNERRGSILSYFKFEPCENLNPPDNSTHEIRKNIQDPSKNQVDNSKNNIEVYPNPSSSSIQLKFNNKYSPTFYEILNIQGTKVVDKVDFPKYAPIDISTLSSGVYIIRTYDGKNVINTKFTKQ